MSYQNSRTEGRNKIINVSPKNSVKKKKSEASPLASAEKLLAHSSAAPLLYCPHHSSLINHPLLRPFHISSSARLWKRKLEAKFTAANNKAHLLARCPRGYRGWRLPHMTLHSVIICSALKKKVYFSKIFNNNLTVEEKFAFEEK